MQGVEKKRKELQHVVRYMRKMALKKGRGEENDREREREREREKRRRRRRRRRRRQAKSTKLVLKRKVRRLRVMEGNEGVRAKEKR
jgi:hypothetical protein